MILCILKCKRLSSLSFYLFIFCVCTLSHARLFAVLWTVAHQVPLSMGFSRQGYWSGLSCPPPGELPDPRTEPISLWSAAPAGRFFATALPGKPPSLNSRPPSFGCPPFPTVFSVFILLFLEHEPLTSPHPPRHMMAPEPWMQRPKPPFLPHIDSLSKTLREHVNSTQ